MNLEQVKSELISFHKKYFPPTTTGANDCNRKFENILRQCRSYVNQDFTGSSLEIESALNSATRSKSTSNQEDYFHRAISLMKEDVELLFKRIFNEGIPN
jgi:hypothetical protein